MAEGARTGRRRLLVGALAAAAAAGAAAGVAALLRARRPISEEGGPLAARPAEELRIRSFDGTELAVGLEGPAGALPTLVFAHGFSLDLTSWHHQRVRFSADHRVVSYDARGHGRSAWARSGDYSLEALAEDLAQVLDEVVPPGPAVLIGHSMGGIAIIGLAARRPELFGDRVVGVVLADTAAADLPASGIGGPVLWAGGALRPAVRRLAADRRRAELAHALATGPGGQLTRLVARASNFGPGVADEVVDHVVRVGSRADLDVWTTLGPNLLTFDVSGGLANVRVPALVIVGELDRITPSRAAREVLSRLPEARLVVLRGAGHTSMLERHGEFDDAVAAFLGGLPR